jgi:uncharacterized membrane protein
MPRDPPGGMLPDGRPATTRADRREIPTVVPFVFLLLVFAGLSLLPLTRLDVPVLRSARARMRLALAAMFVMTGTTHFTATESMLQMVPEFLPLRREAVYLSGLAELAGAAGLLIPWLRRAAGLGLAAMLVAVFPANVNVAVNHLQIDLVSTDPLMQWVRLLVQPVLIWLVVWASGRERPSPAMQAALARA